MYDTGHQVPPDKSPTNSDGGPALPVPLSNSWLRDYFAGQALQGFLAANAKFVGIPDPTQRDYAEMAYRVADAMIQERGVGLKETWQEVLYPLNKLGQSFPDKTP